MNPLTHIMILAVPQGGGYFSLFKLVLFLLLLLAFLRAVTWASQDTIRVKTNRAQWDAINFAVGILGLLLWQLLPFWIGLLVFLVFTGVSLGTYIWFRNSRVAPENRVLTIDHFQQLLGKGKAREIKTVTHDLAFVAADGKAQTPPQEDDPVAGGYEVTQQVVADLIRRRAAEIEVVPAGAGSRVLYRVDGVVQEASPLNRADATQMITYLKTITSLDPKQVRQPQKGSIEFNLSGGDTREMQVKTRGSTKGERLALRIVDPESFLKLDDLGLASKQFDALKAAISTMPGLIVNSGGRSSGLTTTQYAELLSHDAFMLHLHTLEASPSMVLDNVTQNQYQTGGEQSHADQIQSILRRDPDVVMIGQCPDSATAQITAQGATSKKMYLALNADDIITAVSALQKVIDPSVLAETLQAVTNQRLIRKLCPICRVAYKPDPQLLRKANVRADTVEVFYKAQEGPTLDEKGRQVICETCFGVGYLGRTGLFELITMDGSLKHMLKSGANIGVIKTHCRKHGLLYLQEQGLRKVIDGVTSIQEVIRVTKGKKNGPNEQSQT